ncbi:Ger(x)C family spore germination protein [uncultured Negativibacillus sp.]|uniref:Ger(x)C family spore germination protein n=1 Tax=uncultured Negativibacillus sp. TaxID=1980696 RepID=UPI0025EF8956|nr:Ger(x)C family spore germination protein [uncultured Negativibacillus sp.]
MKKWISLLMAAGFALLLCGCMNAAQLKDRTIIKMVGVDLVDGEFVLSMLQFSPQLQSGQEAAAATLVVQTRGRSVSEAVDGLSQYSGNEVFLGNASFLVVGRSAAQQGLESVLGYFNANHEVSPELYVAMAENTAEEVIRTQSEQDSSATQLKTLIEQGQKNGLLGRPALKDVINRLQSDKAEPYLPLVTTEELTDGKKVLKIAGMAIFKEGKFLDNLSIEQTRGVLWATDELKRAVMTVNYGEEKEALASVELTDSESQVKVSMEDGKPVLLLEIRTEGSVLEATFPSGGGVGMEQLGEIQIEVSSQIKDTVRQTVDKVFFEKKSDIFRYSEFIKKYEPDYWKANQENFEQVIDDCRIEIYVDCLIDHPGLEAKHSR